MIEISVLDRKIFFFQDEKLDTLIRNFTDIKDVLNQLGDLRDLDPNHFLGMILIKTLKCVI